MSTKDIRPNDSYIPCDVCGRTLLRGERSEVFIAGGNRHQVCELCKPRALQEGWIREGAVPEYDPAATAADRRRGVFARRRARRDGRGINRVPQAVTLDDALSGDSWPDADGGDGVELDFPDAAPARPARGASRPRRRERPAAEPQPAPAESGRGREPRHVHAVPANEDHRIGAAVDSFNQTEHVRTVAGVARSLGAPAVAVIPDVAHPTLVHLVASWELCWYRYEVDLGSGRASVRLDGQGYELAELSERERVANASADESGLIHAA